MAETEKKTAPYLPFKSLLSAVDSLAPYVPDVIDKSLFDSSSGAMQSAILVAFRFLGLANVFGTTPALKSLVEHPEKRKEELRNILEKSYSEVFAIGLTKATPKQLEEAIAQYNVTGATHQKAVTFFVQAATFAGVPLSQHITRRKARAASRRRAVRSRIVELGQGYEFADTSSPSGEHSNSRTIQLRSGGQLTLGTEFDPFTISTEDRAFIFGLIDQLTAYERGPAESTTEQTPIHSAPRGRSSARTQGITDDDVPF